MKVAKWGNSLAVRIPAEVAEKAGLKEGDEAVLALTPDNVIEIRRDERRQEALRLLRKNQFKVPDDYKFDRNEIYDS
ncbi:MAG TPA: AbrB/MazE/SpoVT family DNA-binding domain-containing protein [Terracidiphilus sp.]|jgi:antitoxin MazE|nr:AbrB/MazE/SpoVT family DNA-binding domain-containing protein [Terracidiphilus sp.]